MKQLAACSDGNSQKAVKRAREAVSSFGRKLPLKRRIAAVGCRKFRRRLTSTPATFDSHSTQKRGAITDVYGKIACDADFGFANLLRLLDA